MAQTDTQHEATMNGLSSIFFHLWPSGGIRDKGLSKREYFAAMAMQAILTSTKFNGNSEKEVAMFAVKYADALLLELEK